MSLTWKIELSRAAQRQLKKLDRSVALEIETFLEQRVAMHPHPQDIASSLKGNLLGLWRFRVGDYRVICDIRAEELVIIAIGIGHRRDVYEGTPKKYL